MRGAIAAERQTAGSYRLFCRLMASTWREKLLNLVYDPSEEVASGEEMCKLSYLKTIMIMQFTYYV